MFRSPLIKQGVITSSYHQHMIDGRHMFPGVDLVYKNPPSLGKPIVSVTKMKITAVQHDLFISDGHKRNGEKFIFARSVDDNRYEFRYVHNQDNGVQVGQIVEEGIQIGTLGNTGWSTGPHLHFEVRFNGVPIDPITVVDFNNWGQNESNSTVDRINSAEYLTQEDKQALLRAYTSSDVEYLINDDLNVRLWLSNSQQRIIELEEELKKNSI